MSNQKEQKNQQNEKRYMLSYTIFEGKERAPRWVRSPFNNEDEVKKLLFTLLIREMKSELEFSNVEIFSEDILDVKTEDKISLREYKFGTNYQNIADRSYEEKLELHNSIHKRKVTQKEFIS
jgi:hypothetical protein